jgi:hypothetical protein
LGVPGYSANALERSGNVRNLHCQRDFLTTA